MDHDFGVVWYYLLLQTFYFHLDFRQNMWYKEEPELEGLLFYEKLLYEVYFSSFKFALNKDFFDQDLLISF